MNETLEGIIVPLITPLKEGEIDLDSFSRHLQNQIAAGVDGLFVCGTAGYGAWLTEKDYTAVLEKAMEISDSRIPVFAGILEPSTDRALERVNLVKSIGADHAVIIPPYYMGISDPLPHFRACAESWGEKIVAYNIPGCTGVKLTRKNLADLIQEGLVSAVKDSSGDRTLFKELCSLPVPVFQGLKPVIGDLKAMGAAGCVPVPANPYPGFFMKAWHNYGQGDMEQTQKVLSRVWDALVQGIDFMRPTAALMARLGIGDGSLLTGLCPLSREETDRLEALMEELTGS